MHLVQSPKNWEKEWRTWKKEGETIQNYSIAEIGQNTEKSPGNMRRLAVTQTPVENHQLTLLWKTLKIIIIIKVTIIPVMIGANGTVTKGLLRGLGVLEIRGRVESIQTMALLRSARMLRKVLETWGDLLLLRLQWKTIS